MSDYDDRPLIRKMLFAGYMYVVLNILVKLSPIRNSCSKNLIQLSAGKFQFWFKTDKSKSSVAIDVRVQLKQMSHDFFKDETYASRDDDWVCSSTHTRLPRKVFISCVRKEQFRAYI